MNPKKALVSLLLSAVMTLSGTALAYPSGLTRISNELQAVFVVSDMVTVDTSRDVSPSNFHTIGEAIDAVPEGGTVAVSSGIYRESVFIDKAVTLKKADGAITKPVLDGTNLGGRGVQIAHSNVVVDGFRIDNWFGGIGAKGITAYQNVTIRNNEITNSRVVDDGMGYGIAIGQQAIDNSNQTVLTEQLNYRGLVISNNIISDVGGFGIVLESITTADDSRITVTGNDVQGAEKSAIWVVSSSNISVADNTSLSNCRDYGVFVSARGAAFKPENIEILGNEISGNAQGIVASDIEASDLIVRSNRITGNTTGLVNLTANALDAKENYWGKVTAPTTGATDGSTDIVGSVDYYRWYTDANCTTLCSDAPVVLTWPNGFSGTLNISASQTFTLDFDALIYPGAGDQESAKIVLEFTTLDGDLGSVSVGNTGLSEGAAVVNTSSPLVEGLSSRQSVSVTIGTQGTYDVKLSVAK